jgi:hypothetical protein
MKIYPNEIPFVGTSHLSVAKAEFSFDFDEANVPNAKKLLSSLAGVTGTVYDEDQMTVVYALLCSIGWNLNDDIFVPEHTFAAVKTPILKPANLDHLGQEKHKVNNTFGFIIDSYPVDSALQVTASVDDIEHIIVAVALWTHYFEDRVKEIETRMAQGKQFVSMECHFRDFDYGLKKINAFGQVEDETTIVVRNEDTSKLTKFLRAYKGKGVVTIDGQKYKIGRVLKNQVFTGVAFVEKPANPQSVVFSQSIRVRESMFAAASFQDFVVEDSEVQSVLNVLDTGVTIMADVKNENEVKNAKAECMDDSAEAMKTLKASYDAKTAEAEALAAELAAAKMTAEEFKAKFVKAEADAQAHAEALAKMTDQVNAMNKATVTAARASQLRAIAQIGFVDTDETKALAQLAEMSEDNWKVTFAGASKCADLEKQLAVAKADKVQTAVATETKENEVKAEDVEKAVAEKTPDLSAVAAASSTKLDDLKNAAAQIWASKNKKKK